MSVLNLKTNLKLGHWGKRRAFSRYVDLHGKAVMIGLRAGVNTHKLSVKCWASCAVRAPLGVAFERSERRVLTWQQLS